MLRFGIFEVDDTNDVGMISFADLETVGQVTPAECRQHLDAILETQATRALDFDLTGVNRLNGPLLGLIAMMARGGMPVRFFNASDDIREILRSTRFDQWIELEGKGECEDEPPVVE